MKKLEVNNAVDMVNKAMKENLVWSNPFPTDAFQIPRAEAATKFA
jgi:hypothetical protein